MEEFSYSQSVRRIIVRAYQIDTQTISNLPLMLEENEDNRLIKLSITYLEETYESQSPDLYLAFQDLKDQLLAVSLGLQCYGSMLNVHPHRGMRNPNNIYVLSLHEQASYDKEVDILKYTNICQFATSQQQNNYYQEWLQSISTQK